MYYLEYRNVINTSWEEDKSNRKAWVKATQNMTFEEAAAFFADASNKGKKGKGRA